ncbi:nuclear transport factor 2 family protein [Leuconostoc suionicum]|uniref:nuclear transport factor 2 family protein n=1 Tax=Leuconostoc suionicum TaxID=1511761 RepID=UPI0024AC9D99|nr:nuclear transport factor 2 family protein [Leuconostoc suionicum]MDI6522882.1 nuclear transport factor 2 family protein [Leuconostoc suionicum]
MINQEEIQILENKLNNAMIKHDINTLDNLLDDQVVFINHFGNMLKKSDDIQSHKNKDFDIESIEVLSNSVTLFKNTAISVSNTQVQAHFGNKKQTDHLIYNRVWQKGTNESIKVISATVTTI